MFSEKQNQSRQLLVILSLLGACTAIPPKEATLTAEPIAAIKELETRNTRSEPVRPKIALTKALLYKILVAEFAGQRGRIDISVNSYLELARETRDPKIVERETRIAVFARNSEAAIEAAQLWVELDPQNADAHQILAVMALRKGNLEQTMEHLQTILDNSHGELSQKFWKIVNFLSREKDKALVMTVMEKLIANHQDDADAIYAFANIAASMGELDRSVELLEQVIDMAPDNDDAVMSYLQVLQQQGNINGAITWLEQALPKRENNDFNLRMTYARLLMAARRFDDARRQYEILSVSAPNNTVVLNALGQLYLQVNRLDDAEIYFKRLSEQRDHSDNARYWLGRIYEEHEKYEQASVWYEGVQRGEIYFDAQIRIGLILVKIANVDDAFQYLQGIRTSATREETTQNNIAVLNALGQLYLKVNRLDDGEIYFKRLSEQSGHSDNASYWLGRIYEEREKYKQASVWYEGVQRGENYFDAQIRIGLIMAKIANVDNALQYLQGIRTSGTRQETTLVQAEGELLVEEERYEEAKAVFDKALIDNNNPDLLYSRAMLAEKMGRIDILEKDLRNILGQEPDNAQALNALGYTLADRTDRYQEAYDLIQQAVSLSPSDHYILDSLGWVLYRLGQHDEAVDYLRQAMEIRQDPEIAAHLGEVLWVIGDKKAAKEVWDAALQITPEDIDLLDVIKRFNP